MWVSYVLHFEHLQRDYLSLVLRSLLWAFMLVTGIVRPYFCCTSFCPLPHCTAPLPLKVCVRTEVMQGPCPWLGFPSAPTYSTVTGVTPMPLPQPGEKPLPWSKPWGKLRSTVSHVQSLVFLWVSNAGAQQLAVQGKAGPRRPLTCF